MIKNRQEILFLYDVTDANPNGDPLDENKPRIDEETGINIVTDVRLKRTVRDYLYNYKGYDGSDGKDIFVREIESEKGGIKDGKARAKDFKENLDEILEKAIDIRLFGGVIPLDKASITFTGPVQFNMGRSLNKVNLKHIKGTGAFASGEGKAQKTFREEYIVPYSMIAFHGIINENAAKETRLTDEDVDLLDEAMWNGTKNLITRSKMGHMPRIMLRVVYKEGQNFFIGDLQNKIALNFDMEEEKIRTIKDYSINLDELIDELAQYSDKIEKVVFVADRNLKLSYKGQGFDLKDIKEIQFQEKTF
ncbi:type I-B CRISPR-associated protein Cas7/Csh2 [Acetivibrio mesophilus]|uniref:Type I-B CRISPR-associated protein Cas7/Csh2 n=1 Tax=Acetivibrio mesophilus TaxID=2487273 RepID=A0A4Q0I282_9FIRM|nr:type I-B CRISPR-associated protein Cas7/Csh2 [Acetivibrio mesophilus]ODM24785.1 type I-B CRISPR-associated protein Cas7/Csh2 [Clostridium sp. Bc-iso-3]RXE57787.1 type I-B CRISPR-associated protein Cas7/Csh2 [Acetivibrio mesophilus]HHV29766.1 type I-B CRISPR-associated protein Cas7/Csh2 [Clostridium sp.]